MKEMMYDKTGSEYNKTRTADDFITAELYNLLQPKSNFNYLDIGCGTGNYTIALSNFGIKMCGVDPSKKMIEVARGRNIDIEWKIGSAEKIPYPDNHFQGTVGTLTIHHWTDLKKAFRELCRVLTNNGDIVLFTSTPEQMKGYWLNHYFPLLLNESIKRMPSIDNIKSALNGTKLIYSKQTEYFIKHDLKDHFLYIGKDKPEIYLDEKIRKGISSFTSFASTDEVYEGVIRLKKDIKTGKIRHIMKEYENAQGDYLFIKIIKDTSH
jgi:ubiquinone/menaquinone biosynthesis C-methylase UbiE